MKSFIQFLTTPTVDTPGTALILHFDDKRYLIGNIHEGAQRACIEPGTKLVKVSDIFLTGKTEWRNTGGLIGMILTLADATRSAAGASEVAAAERAKMKAQRYNENISRKASAIPPPEPKRPAKPEKKHTLTVHGGPNVTHTLATARRFVFRKGMPVDVDEIKERQGAHNWEPTWSDKNIRVWAMSIIPPIDTDPLSDTGQQSPRKRSFDEYQESTLRPAVAQLDQFSEQDALQDADRDQQVRRAVVCDMFDSDWRLDALVETPIAQVQMPATLFIRDPETRKIEKYVGPLPGGSEPLPDINVLVRRPWPGALIDRLPPTSPSLASTSYIIRNHPLRGKFQRENAVALNVQEGPLFRQLAMGNPVLSKDGKTVLPEQVMGEGKVGSGFAVVELPSKEYVQGLIERPEWRVNEVMEGVELIIWILGPGVGIDDNLSRFMTEYGHLKHIISSQDYCPNSIALDSASSAAIRLNQLDPVRFPIPIHNNKPKFRLEEQGATSISSPTRSLAARGLTIQLEPSFIIQDNAIVPPLNTAEILRDTPKDVILLAKAIRQDIASAKVQTEIYNQNLPSADAEIITLGTGSALPSKYRNVSATLLRVPGSGSYLLDCGENTLGQLSRVYTSEELVEVLRDLKMIWISHLHADHHLGTTSVIKAWYHAVYGQDYNAKDEPAIRLTDQLLNPAKVIRDQKRLFVASDSSMLQWLGEYASVEDYGYDKIVPLNVIAARLGNPDTTRLDWMSSPLNFKPVNTEISNALRAATGLTDFAAANVAHCHGAKAVSLTFPTGFKFSYSGDCRPSRSFTEIGQDSTVLLHEATFDDELKGDAEAKQHCTTSEALGVGIAMGARRVLLTHFSQRYQKIPVMDGLEGQDLELEEADGTNGDSPMSALDPGSATFGSKTSLGEMVESDTALDEILSADSRPHRQSPSRIRSRSRSTSPSAINNSNNHPPGSPKIIKVHSSGSKSRIQDMKIGVAFDYMRVKVRDIALLEKFTPALLKL
ncbi:MAG: hypothetical protein Q9187_002397, partial [Circinaria calcarea]